MTLEEAQEKIIELTDQLATVTGERDTLSSDNETLRTDNDNLRALNQKYFNRLIAQEAPEDNHDKEAAALTCEEFAATLDI